MAALGIWCAFAVALGLEAGPRSVEVVRAASGAVSALTGAWEGAERSRRVFLVDVEGDRMTFLRPGVTVENGPSFSTRVAGPIPWGIVRDAVYTCPHSRSFASEKPPLQLSLHGTQIFASIEPIDDIVNGELLNWGEHAGPIVQHMREFVEDHGCHALPLMDYIKTHSEELAHTWDLSFDLLYLDLDHVVLGAARDGTMSLWDLPESGYPMGEWTAREPFATEIEGPFRLLRAGVDLETMYFIDETGAIHTGFGEEHARVGTVQNFASADPDTLTLIFEDQMTEKIGIMHAAPGELITVLPIDWVDPEHAENFITSIEDANLRTDLNRVADFLREDRPE